MAEQIPVFRIIRMLLFRPQPKMSLAEARIAAQEECMRRGWLWTEPVDQQDGLFYWYFRTNALSHGCNNIIHVDMIDGHIIRAGRLYF